MIQFSEGYNAQTIFDQVWEAPYEWFGAATSLNNGEKLPAFVHELDDAGQVLETYLVTIDSIEKAVIEYYMEYVSEQKKPPTMADYLEDLDANDVDCILQLACFGEIRYS